MTGGRLAVRVVLAAVFGGVAAALLYYVPASLGGVAEQLAGGANASAVQSIVGALVSPSLPLIGLAAAALVFVGVLLRGTRGYGPVLVVLGAVLVAYVYTAFQGGTINISIPQGVQYGASGTVSISLAALMYLAMVGPLLTVVKGVVLTAARQSRTPA
jgi:hypothetical protein